MAAYDVLIVGGGPAGLSAALGLARQGYSALIFDARRYRNEAASYMHNVLTWDHTSPHTFRAKARENIVARYPTVSFRDETITRAQKVVEGFELITECHNTYLGKKLILASGVTDILPMIKGFAEHWGREIFHCLFCHGFEERGAGSAGILATGFLSSSQMVIHTARMAMQLGKTVTIYCDGDDVVSAALRRDLVGKQLEIESGKIREITRCEGAPESVEIHFAEGSCRREDFLVSMPATRTSGPFVRDLELETDPAGHIKVEAPFGETSTPGCFAAGDCATLIKAVNTAMSMGSLSAAGAVAQLGAKRL